MKRGDFIEYRHDLSDPSKTVVGQIIQSTDDKIKVQWNDGEGSQWISKNDPFIAAHKRLGVVIHE